VENAVSDTLALGCRWRSKGVEYGSRCNRTDPPHQRMMGG
jgi:hypothetical protein